MSRPRLTQVFPWLLPLRKRQRALCFYARQRMDGNRYAGTLEERRFAHALFQTSSPLYNDKTGFDMAYQRNKAFNVQLLAKRLDGLVIRPGEVFSFWNRARGADRGVGYKDGLVFQDGRLQAAPGGGLCQMSNMLHWMFLHTPMTVLERHGHAVKDFPDAEDGLPKGVDATVSEGWLDLMVKNDTDAAYQIGIEFDSCSVFGRILVEAGMDYGYEVCNGDVGYRRTAEGVFEEAEVVRRVVHLGSGEVVREGLLYVNRCRIGYELLEG